MYFSQPSPYELGGSPDMETEDAILAANGINPHKGSETDLMRLEGSDPIGAEHGARIVKGFSLTAIDAEPIEQRLGISDIGDRLTAGLEGTYYDRIIGSAKLSPDCVILSEPTMRPL